MKIVQVITNAMNGDVDSEDPAVMGRALKRAVVAMAGELDEQSLEWDRRLNGLSGKIDSAVKSINHTIEENRIEAKAESKKISRLLVGVTSSIIVGIIVGLMNLAATAF